MKNCKTRNKNIAVISPPKMSIGVRLLMRA